MLNCGSHVMKMMVLTQARDTHVADDPGIRDVAPLILDESGCLVAVRFRAPILDIQPHGTRTKPIRLDLHNIIKCL